MGGGEVKIYFKADLFVGLIFFSLNWLHWADSVIKLPCLSTCVFVCASLCAGFFKASYWP